MRAYVVARLFYNIVNCMANFCSPLWLALGYHSCVMPTGRLQTCKNKANSRVPVINTLLAWNLQSIRKNLKSRLLHHDWASKPKKKGESEAALSIVFATFHHNLLRMCMWKKLTSHLLMNAIFILRFLKANKTERR